jgi:signal peptidase II
MTRRNLVPIGVCTALLVLAADQSTKWWILNVLDLPNLRQVVLLPFLNLAMVWNRGVTFGLLNGLGAWGHVVLVLIALGVVAALGTWLRRAETGLTAVAIGAITGGALGNIVDRLRYGAVVDFIQASIYSPWGNLFPWVFNVADSAIVCGVAVLILESQLSRRRQERERLST